MTTETVIPLANPIARHWNWMGGCTLRRFGDGRLPETDLDWPKHGFTHVDAPCHMIRNGPTLDDCRLGQLCGEAAIIDVSDCVPAAPVGSDLLTSRGGHVRRGDILILRSLLHRQYPNSTPDYWERSPWLDESGSRWVVERGCTALAVDFPQDWIARELGKRPVTNPEFLEHQIVLGAGLMHLEHAIDLDRIPGERTFLIGLPLRLAGADGGPCSPVALTSWPARNPRIVDLTLPVRPGRRIQVWLEKSFEAGDPVQETGVRYEGHAGTHVLAPRYLDAEADGVDALLGETLVGPADLADLSGPGHALPIGVDTLAERLPETPGGRILLLRHAGGANARGEADLPWLSGEAATWIADRRYRAVGSDFELDAGRRRLAGNPARTSDLEAEAVLLGRGVALLKNLAGLDAIGTGRPWVAALPLRLPGAEAAPARVVALDWQAAPDDGPAPAHGERMTAHD